MKCMQNDWQLDAKWASSVVLWLAKVTGRAGAMVMVDLHFLKAELKKDPQTALRTITDAYLKLVKDAKQKRKEGDPWPVIIDEANALMEWKDAETLSALLKFFVYLTKQEQLAHVILATSDTFLMQWLESGAPRLAVAGLSCFRYLSCGRRSHQRPVPRHSRGEQLDPRGGAHLLLRLHRAVPQTSAWRERSMGARVRIMRRQPRAAAELRFEGGQIW